MPDKKEVKKKITPDNPFAILSKIDVREHTEKKGKFTYLSWAWAWGILKDNFPLSTFDITYFDGLPYTKDEKGWAYVEVAVHIPILIPIDEPEQDERPFFIQTAKETLPVLNHSNKPIQNPDSFQVNTAIKRCLAKAIAMHGLGFYIYAGEDLPVSTEEEGSKPNIHVLPDPKAGLITGIVKQTTERISKCRNAAHVRAIMKDIQSKEQLKDAYEILHPIAKIKIEEFDDGA